MLSLICGSLTYRINVYDLIDIHRERRRERGRETQMCKWAV
jgi:hypothetical protein